MLLIKQMIITKILDEGNRSGRHFMKGYPYKRNFPFKPNTTPQPYIKKKMLVYMNLLVIIIYLKSC